MSRHNTDPGNKLVHVGRQVLHVELLSSEDEKHDDRSSNPYSTVLGILRQFRLKIFTVVSGRCLDWRSDTEYRKVAMYRSRTVAATYGLLHLCPLGGAIGLLVLQWTSYFVGFTNDDSTALQFVAKLHEMFMQASIVEIIVFLVRTQLINGFIPFGLLSSICNPTQLSYIWSLDYMSVFKSPAIWGWRKWFFALAIPALILLISFVGPSSAILMIPRPNSPREHKSVTMYARNSTETMFPTAIGASNGFNIQPSSLNKTIKTQIEFEQLDQWNKYRSYGAADLTNAHGIGRIMRFRENNGPNMWNEENIMASRVNITVPAEYSSDSFTELAFNGIGRPPMFSENGTATVKMAYPVVITQCWRQFSPLHSEAKIYYVTDAATLTSFSTLGSLAEKISNPSEVDQDSGYENYAPLWTSSPHAESMSLFPIFVSRGLSKTNRSDPSSTYVNTSYSLTSILRDTDYISKNDGLTVMSCKVSAFWDFGDVQLQSSAGKHAVQTLSSAKSLTQDARPIRMNISHIDTIRSARFCRQLNESIPNPDASRVDTITFSLGAIFALGISKFPPIYQRRFMDPSRLDEESFERGRMVPYLLTGVDVANTTVFKFTLTDYAYGYGARSLSVYLAMVVITTYCIITIIYLIYTITTGSTSTAWNSGIELVTLALQSRKTDHLGHASVGIDSVKTFSESVGIRVNTNDELELIFAHDSDLKKRGLSSVQWNKEY